jgi:argininosuccinate synthase
VSAAKVVLAYSGGLDTSVILTWLKEQRAAEVIAFIADVGQGEDLRAVACKAEKTGADHVVVADLREEFVRDFVFPAIQANAVYEGTYLMGTSLARPVIARHLVKAAHAHGAGAIAHGATGKGNDQVRFELTAAALDPKLEIVAPWREWSFTGREDLFRYAEQHGIELPVTREKPYSMDANLMHISYEGGVLEDPWAEPPQDMFRMTVAPERAPDQAAYVEVDFERGVPVGIDGERLGPVELLARANALAGKHGVGRVDVVENRFIGMKSRGVYETPGATLLHAAHRAVESLTLDREVMHLRDSLIPRFAELVYYGFWYSPEMRSLLAFVESTQSGVEGTARLKLYKGSAQVVGRKSPRSLYDPETASFETFGSYDSRDAGGFIRMNALRLRLNRALGEPDDA